MQKLPKIEFYRAVIGTPENCKRIWQTLLKTNDIYIVIQVWQDGAWWCMQQKRYSDNVSFSTTWGDASYIMQLLQEHGHVAGLNHIDFMQGNWNA